MNQFLQRLLSAFEAKPHTPAAAAEASEALHVLTAQQALAVAGGPQVTNNDV